MGELPGSVLFCCNMNSVRSPMAEAITKHLLGHVVYVDSAGVRSGEINGFAIAALDELGIDITRHNAKTFDDLDGASFDLIVSLTPEAHHRALEFTRHGATRAEYWPTHDPTLSRGSRETVLQAFRDVRDELMTRIKARFETVPAPKV